MDSLPQIPRIDRVRQLERALEASPVVALLGPRQCGKTWLARRFARRPENYFDLQSLVDRVRLEDSNFRVLDGLVGTVVIDEAQLNPELFPKLRVLADRTMNQARFLLTGSASPRITRGISESLAGRVRQVHLGGFDAAEVGWGNWEGLWERGGFPDPFLRDEDDSFEWRLDFISTFVARDLPLLAETRISEQQLRRLLQLVAHSHGQYWNHSEAGKVIGVNAKTVQRYLEVFKGAFIVRELPPFVTNLRKRLRKAPKIYFRDSGLLHALLMLRERVNVASHPRYGASWEGFCIEQIVQLTRSRDEECFTWSVQGGAEVDLVLKKPSGLFGFEFKAADAPRRTRSMSVAMQDLPLDRLFVVYPGRKDYGVGERIDVVGFENLGEIVAAITK